MKRFVISQAHGSYRCVLWHPLQYEHLGLTAKQLERYLNSHHSKNHFLGEDFDIIVKGFSDKSGSRSKFSELLRVNVNSAIVMVGTVRMEKINGDLLPDNYPLDSETVLVGDVRIMANKDPIYQTDFDNQLNGEDSLFEFRPRAVLDPSQHHITSIVAFDLKHKQHEYA